MIDPIVSSAEPVLLVGGADLAPEEVNICLSHAPRVVAADGGANHLLGRPELRPVAVIGDMDSLSKDAAAEFADVLHTITEQDSTDFDKALRSTDAPLVLAIGFLGGRLDHQMAALNVLGRQSGRRVVLVGGGEIVFLLPGQLTLMLEPGQPVAVLPLGHAQVSSTGLRWDLEGQTLHPTGLISTSNAVAEPRVSLAATGPVIVSLPLAALGAVVRALHGE